MKKTHKDTSMNKEGSIETKSAINRGFTLVETMVYLALFVIILVAIVNSVLLLSNSYRNVRVSRSIETSAINVMDRVVREVRNANSIDFSQSSFGINPSALSLNSVDASGNPRTTRFYLLNGKVMMQENGSLLGPLTSSDVTVSSLVFRNISASSSTAIKIDMTISGNNANPIFISREFYGTAVIRGSY